MTTIAVRWDALVAGIREYLSASGLAGLAVSVSGGVDSAVVLAMAVAAIGKEKVFALTCPGPFTSPETLADAEAQCRNLGVRLETVPITPLYEASRAALVPAIRDAPPDPEDIAGQNLQARIRGMLLMGIANRRRLLALNCTNRSEAMVGYGTLYGDLVGGLSPLGDVWKTDVWALARHANEVLGAGTIPQSVIDRVPSAELRAGQEDRQSLPDYPELDAILSDWLDRGMDEKALLAAGHRPETVARVMGLAGRSEFKRRQMPPALRLTSGRRSFPLNSKFH